MKEVKWAHLYASVNKTSTGCTEVEEVAQALLDWFLITVSIQLIVAVTGNVTTIQSPAAGEPTAMRQIYHLDFAQYSLLSHSLDWSFEHLDLQCRLSSDNLGL